MTCGKGLLPLNNAFKTSNGRKPCPISGAALSPKGWSTTYVSSAKPSPKTQNKSPLPTGASFYCTWATGAVNGQQKSTKALHLLSKSRQSTEGHHQVLLNIRLIGTGGKHIKEELDLSSNTTLQAVNIRVHFLTMAIKSPMLPTMMLLKHLCCVRVAQWVKQ